MIEGAEVLEVRRVDNRVEGWVGFVEVGTFIPRAEDFKDVQGLEEGETMGRVVWVLKFDVSLIYVAKCKEFEGGNDLHCVGSGV